jgi:ubiquinone/menaquinone biosynthesis C-methylase UbiE
MSDEQRIRETYRDYDETGRAHLWDRSNRGYARLSDDRDAALLRLLARSLPVATGRTGPDLLDAGCGDGQLLRTVLERWPDVRGAGIDLLADRIEVARRTLPDAQLVVASADALPFDDDAFDVVAAITLFSSIPSETMETAAAREIGRVLRPGGWLVWYDLRHDNPSNRAVHGVGRRRLGRLFPGWHAEVRSLTVAPPLARRLGRLTPVAYPLLHAVPPLRSHLVGRLRCPG